MKATVFVTGYVGLVQEVVLAEVRGCRQGKVERLRQCHIPFYEAGPESLVRGNDATGLLQFNMDAAQCVLHGEVQSIAVGTPPDEDGSADLKYVLAVAGTVATNMLKAKIIVDKCMVLGHRSSRLQGEVSTLWRLSCKPNTACMYGALGRGRWRSFGLLA